MSGTVSMEMLWLAVEVVRKARRGEGTTGLFTTVELLLALLLGTVSTEMSWLAVEVVKKARRGEGITGSYTTVELCSLGGGVAGGVFVGDIVKP